jgi:hypothetical protein
MAMSYCAQNEDEKHIFGIDMERGTYKLQQARKV